MHAALADAIVALHAAYVGFIVFGMILIPIGGILGWKWVRNRWYRGIHLAMIAYVAFEAIVGIRCPLTVWEEQLRAAAGQTVDGVSFIGRCLDRLIFYQLPERAFTQMYIAATLTVAATLWWVPPQWRRATQ